MSYNVGDIVCYGWSLYEIVDINNCSYQLYSISGRDRLMVTKQQLEDGFVSREFGVVVRYCGIGKSFRVTELDGREGSVYIVSGVYLMLKLEITADNCLVGTVINSTGSVLWEINSVADLRDLDLKSENVYLKDLNTGEFINSQPFLSIEQIASLVDNCLTNYTGITARLTTSTEEDINTIGNRDYVIIGNDICAICDIEDYYIDIETIPNCYRRTIPMHTTTDVIRKPVVFQYTGDGCLFDKPISIEDSTPCEDVSTVRYGDYLIAEIHQGVLYLSFPSGIVVNAYNNEIVSTDYLAMITKQASIYCVETGERVNDVSISTLNLLLYYISELDTNYTYRLLSE